MANSSPEKMELRRGPWSHQEDQILISYVQKNGHGNWRALPQKAGLLRCGKSCRLRWTNYLRPDIKRGKLSQKEEETIFRLHEVLGNRWAAIAAQLPGRTDNEIKNLWNAHLKKRLKTSTIPTPESNSKVTENSNSAVTIVRSPQECSSSGISTVTNSLTDESLWMERLTNEDAACWKAAESGNVDRKLQFPVEEDGSDFWFDILAKVGDMKEMPKF